MVEYKCNKCCRTFNKKSNYNYHLKRKIPCQNIIIQNIPQISTLSSTQNSAILAEQEEDTSHKCNYCNKTFSRSDSLNRHITNYCKIKKQQCDQKETIYQTLLKRLDIMETQNKELLNEVNKMKQENKNIVVNNTNNNTMNNTTNVAQLNQLNNINIKVVAFRKEDLSHITNEIYAKILNKGFKSVPNLVDCIHFNKNRPENHNVYISNMRDKHVLVYDGEDWKLKEKDEILQQLVDDKTEMLSEKFDELVDKLDEPTITKFKRFLDQKDDDKVISGIKNDLRLMLYNNRRVPEKTRGTIELTEVGKQMI